MNEMGLVAYRCKKCGKMHYPPHDRCLNCKGREFEEVRPQGNATLLTFTQIFNLPWGFDERFLIIGVGEFENGVRAMGQIKAESLDALQPGMPMRASWEPIRVLDGEIVYGLKFDALR